MSNTVLITGSNRGIGLELVRQYADAGWRVLATCRNPDKATALHEIAGVYPDTVAVERLDVSDFDQIDALATRHKDEPIDVLISNAGVFGPKNEGTTDFLQRIHGQLLGNLDYLAFVDTFWINTLAPIRLTEALLPNVERGELKKVVYVSSSAGSIAGGLSFPAPIMPFIYTTTKAALNKAMTTASKALKDRHVTVVSICPGHVKTDFGGPDAAVEVSDSVRGVRAVIEGLSLDDSGRFIRYDGEAIPW